MRTSQALAALALAVGFAATGCNSSTTEATETTEATTAEVTTTTHAPPADGAQLQSLVPVPADSETKGPDTIHDDGIHLHFKATGTPTEVMDAYKAALTDKGWAVTTIASSSGDGGGGATFTGTHGEVYGVFDGGGYETNTYIDVCAWPTMPAEPNCTRGDR